VQLLPPYRISGELQAIVQEAKAYVVLVSPYVKLHHWRGLADALSAAIKRGVKVELFTRQTGDNLDDWQYLENLGLRPRAVQDLHAKLYFNETSGLVTSMNMLGSSHSNSLEIGYKTETPAEVEQLRAFIKDYVMPKLENLRPPNSYPSLRKKRFFDALEEEVAKATADRVWVTSQDDDFIIQAVNNKFFLFYNERGLTIEAIISGRQADKYDELSKKLLTSPAFHYAVLPPTGEGTYNRIGATYQLPLSAKAHPDNLRLDEKEQLMAALIEFFASIQRLKGISYL
jgi:PLD-like domain